MLKPVVTAIGIVKGKSGTQVTISGDTELSYEYLVTEGKTLAIDIPGAASTVWPADQKFDDDEFVSRIRVAEQTDGQPGVRVVLSLKKPDVFTIAGENNRIVISFAAQGDTAAPGRTHLNRVAEVTATRSGNFFRVAVKTDAKPEYRVLESADPKRVTIAIDGARLEPNSRAAGDFSAGDAPVSRIAAWTEPKDPAVVLVGIDLREPLPFIVTAAASGLDVDFSVAASARNESPAVAITAPPLPPAPNAAASLAAIALEPPRSARNYAGRKVSLDFLDADIADIFRLIADVSGMNIVANDDVKGKRSVKITDVPWDQALDLILETNIPTLVSASEGMRVIRVMTKKSVEDAVTERAKSIITRQDEQRRQEESLQKMAENRRNEAQRVAESRRNEVEKDREFAALNGSMVSRTFKLSYIDKVEDVRNLFYGIASQRVPRVGNGTTEAVKDSSGNTLLRDGYIRDDARTRTILVRDLEPNVNEMASLLAKIDLPTPAVLVEARIVEVSSETSESFGVQWGADFSADSAHGNSTRYAFPNSVGVSGNQDNYMVNLPASNASSGVGIKFGHIANIFSLDLQLSAMEKLGKSKLLSSPKIMVVDNKQAYIKFGDALPITKKVSTTDNTTNETTSTQTVEFEEIPLKLKVTPHVTNDQTVFMDVYVLNKKRGATVTGFDGNETVSIVEREAETSVLVADGETTVIGGIFVETTDDTGNSVPGLSKLPFLGWLFKSKSNSASRKEMIIFLTPHIVRPVPRSDPALQ